MSTQPKNHEKSLDLAWLDRSTPLQQAGFQKLQTRQEVIDIQDEIDNRRRQLMWEIREEEFLQKNLRHNVKHKSTQLRAARAGLMSKAPVSSSHLQVNIIASEHPEDMDSLRNPQRRAIAPPSSFSSSRHPHHSSVKKKWSKRFLVQNRDWRESYAVKLTKIVRPETETKTRLQRQFDEAAIRIQRAFQRRQRRQEWRVTAASLQLGSKLDFVRSSTKDLSSSSSEILESAGVVAGLATADVIRIRIELEVDREMKLSREHSAARIIQRWYHQYIVGRHLRRLNPSESSEVRQSLERTYREARRTQRLVQWHVRERAAITLQAYTRGRACRNNRISLRTAIVRTQVLEMIQAEQNLVVSWSENPDARDSYVAQVARLSQKYAELATDPAYRDQEYRMIRMSALLGKNALLLGLLNHAKVDDDHEFSWLLSLARTFYRLWQIEEGSDAFVLEECARLYDRLTKDTRMWAMPTLWLEYAHVVYAQGLFSISLACYQKVLEEAKKVMLQSPVIRDEIEWNILMCDFQLGNYKTCSDSLAAVLVKAENSNVELSKDYTVVDLMLLRSRCEERRNEDSSVILDQCIDRLYSKDYRILHEHSARDWSRNAPLWHKLGTLENVFSVLRSPRCS